jgi:hypothetical protein
MINVIYARIHGARTMVVRHNSSDLAALFQQSSLLSHLALSGL